MQSQMAKSLRPIATNCLAVMVFPCVDCTPELTDRAGASEWKFWSDAL
jgi:hypothetical protein